MLPKITLVITALLFSLSVLAAGNQYVLGVKGLACPFCAFGIEKRLHNIEGVSEVQVDVVQSVVRVTMDQGQSLTEDRARQAIREAGFTLGSFSPAKDQTGGQDGK